MTDVAVPEAELVPEPCCKPKSRFWLGFLLGLPVYPLLMPWILFSIPRDWAESYLRFYAHYIKFVMHALGIDPFFG